MNNLWENQTFHYKTPTNKQLLQKLKIKKFNDSVVLTFMECSCYIQNFVIRQKELVSEICFVTFSNFGNWITFGPLRIRCFFYIWTTLLITIHAYAVVVISLHTRKYAVLLHMAWLNGKKLGSQFELYSHKSWRAALVYDSVYSLLDLQAASVMPGYFLKTSKFAKQA